MIDTIYIEECVLDLPRTHEILKRYPKSNQLVIEHYGELFNSSAQNFRLQKQNPALILAAKQNKRVLSAPEQYETGGGAHYYFSHMLNCLYDCRYCFLQGMLRSANYLLFVNYEDFHMDIQSIAEHHSDDDKPCWFFSGYDCDSLAFEPVSSFAASFVPLFETLPNSILELRTKSTQIRSLLKQQASDRVVVAYSLSPDSVARGLEEGAPSVAKRLQALQELQKNGWRLGIRFDPIIWHQNYEHHYQALIDQTFSMLDSERIDSITLGGFRLPKHFHKTMQKLYPEHWLFRAGLSLKEGMVTYRDEIEAEVFEKVSRMILKHAPAEKLFCYQGIESEAV